MMIDGQPLTLVADRFLYEDWQDLQSVLGEDWVVGEPSLSWGQEPVVFGYHVPGVDTFSGGIDKLELETELYKLAVDRGAVEYDAMSGSFMIDWATMEMTLAQQVRELLIELMGFREDDL